jgi:hypothetical protein
VWTTAATGLRIMTDRHEQVKPAIALKTSATESEAGVECTPKMRHGNG